MNELKKFLHGDVATDDATLEKYSRDYSIFKVRPKAVVFPRNAEDVKRLVKFALKNKISLTARSGGTDMTGGPLGEGIILDFARYFNRIKAITRSSAKVPTADKSLAGKQGGAAVVEPGVYFRDFEEELKKRGLFYPPYPASKDICALG